MQLSQLGSQQAAVAAEVWALEGLVARVCEVSQEGGASLGGPVEFMAASSLLLQECDHFGQKVSHCSSPRSALTTGVLHSIQGCVSGLYSH